MQKEQEGVEKHAREASLVGFPSPLAAFYKGGAKPHGLAVTLRLGSGQRHTCRFASLAALAAAMASGPPSPTSSSPSNRLSTVPRGCSTRSLTWIGVRIGLGLGYRSRGHLTLPQP